MRTSENKGINVGSRRRLARRPMLQARLLIANSTKFQNILPSGLSLEVVDYPWQRFATDFSTAFLLSR
jgi:hypothetical protein